MVEGRRGISQTPAERMQAVRTGIRELPGFTHPVWTTADQFLTSFGVVVHNPGGRYHGWQFSPSIDDSPQRFGKDSVAYHLRRAPGEKPGEWREEIELDAHIARLGVRAEHNLHLSFRLDRQGIIDQAGAAVVGETEALVADLVGAVVLQK